MYVYTGIVFLVFVHHLRFRYVKYIHNSLRATVTPTKETLFAKFNQSWFPCYMERCTLIGGLWGLEDRVGTERFIAECRRHV